MLTFPSAEWLASYKEAVNASDGYRKAGATWTYGPVVLLVKADASLGLPEPVGFWLDLHEGVCRDAKVVSESEASRAPFCIRGEYARWKMVLKKQLDPIQGMMQKKLELRGQMSVIVRYVQASKELVEAAQRVPTKFLDE